MVLSTSPRKAVPLASGDDWEQAGPSKVASITKRVFFCGVVVESEGGNEISEGPSSMLIFLACNVERFTQMFKNSLHLWVNRLVRNPTLIRCSPGL
jgi:hypothetical protein